MKSILYSVLTILVALVAVVSGTGAFFSDPEHSSGNTFAAGIIDLTVDNESYYNGAISTSTTWLEPADLDDGRLFFNFTDLKPDDEGEDTISLHVGTNDAWACMDVVLTSNDDISSNEPELDGTGDVLEDPDDTWDGELAQNLQFVWWADDGDNVFEDDEPVISDGVENLLDLASSSGKFFVPLADAAHNVWGDPIGTPLAADEIHYVGKAWCFGDLTIDTPVPQDFATTSGPLDGRGTGWACDGTDLGNETQTDGVTVDMAFRAFQARHVEDFLCESQEPRVAEITVIKELITDDGGNEVISDFQLFVDNGTVITNVTSGVPTVVAAGTYNVNEQGVQGYEASFSGDCDSDGNIVLSPGDSKTCTITNNDLPATITLIKQVINNDGGTAGPTVFGLRINGNLVPHLTSVEVPANAINTIDEDGRAGYSFVSMSGFSIYGKDCPNTLGGTITLDEGEALFCTIVNDDDPQP